MKVLISLCVLATFVVYSQCYTEEDTTTCLKENNINLENSTVSVRELMLSDEYKCYLYCILKRGGYVKENGDVQGDVALTDSTIIDGTESRRQQIAECINKIGSANSCVEGYRVAECFQLGLRLRS